LLSGGKRTALAASSSAICRVAKKNCAIPPFEFENWAVIALGGIPNKARIGDMGVDCRIYPVSSAAKMLAFHQTFRRRIL
jgi:hypothetical protein